MRCNICNCRLDRIIQDPNVRGGVRPCTQCDTISRDAVIDQERLYDESDPTVDIAETVSLTKEESENQYNADN